MTSSDLDDSVVKTVAQCSVEGSYVITSSKMLVQDDIEIE